MASRRRRIPSLEPHGTGAVISTEYPERKRTDRRPDAEREDTEPWRGYAYADREWRASRITAIERTRGHCARCGRVVATRDSRGRWRCRGGQVHHVTPLHDGGGSDAGNAELLCTRCHAAADAAIRGERGRERG